MTRRSMMLAAALIVLGSSEVAEGQTRVQISPQILETTVSPGGTMNEVISFTNAGTNPVYVTLEPADFEVDETGNPEIYPIGLGPSGKSLAPYLRVSPIEVRADPDQTVRFRLVAKLPEEFTHLREMLYFVARPIALEEAPGQTVIVPKVGVPLYVESTESRPARLEVSNDEVVRTENGVRINLETKNTGERIIRPPVIVEVSDDDGFYEVFEPNAGIAPVLPDNVRKWSFDIAPLPRGPLSVRMTFPVSLRDSVVEEYQVPAMPVSEPETE